MLFVLYGGAFAATALVLYVAYRRAHLLVVALALLALSAATFGLAYAASETHWHDADGWVDCWPSCTAIQELTRFGLFFSPLIVLLAGFALAFGALARRHSNRSTGTAAG